MGYQTGGFDVANLFSNLYDMRSTVAKKYPGSIFTQLQGLTNTMKKAKEKYLFFVFLIL